MKRIFLRFLELFLAFALVSCAGLKTALPTPVTEEAPTSRPPAPKRVSPASLPPICDCVLRFDHISIEQGLSQSSVRAILQDSRGFMWFGTEDGLNRYDGYRFTVYRHDPSDPLSLPSDVVWAIDEDAAG